MVLLVMLVNLDLLAQMAALAPKVHKVLPDPWVKKVIQAPLEVLAMKDRRDRKVILALKVQRDLRDHKELKDIPDLKESLAQRERKDHLALMVNLDKRDLLAQLALLAVLD